MAILKFQIWKKYWLNPKFFFAVCIGTNGRMSVPNNRENHYRNLRDRYTNCTYVDGNLELTWLQDENRDLDFLKDIREVSEKLFILYLKQYTLGGLKIFWYYLGLPIFNKCLIIESTIYNLFAGYWLRSNFPCWCNSDCVTVITNCSRTNIV